MHPGGQTLRRIEPIECRKEFDLGEITGGAEDDECAVFHVCVLASY
jgi:hypothetical protein